MKYSYILIGLLLLINTGFSINTYIIATSKQEPIEISTKQPYNSNEDVKTQIDGITMAMDNINTRLDKLFQQMATLNTSSQVMTASASHSRDENIIIDHDVYHAKDLSKQEIEIKKNEIYDSLSSMTMTIPQVLASSKLNTLPKEEQNKLVKDIIDRYNNGDLPR